MFLHFFRVTFFIHIPIRNWTRNDPQKKKKIKIFSSVVFLFVSHVLFEHNMILYADPKWNIFFFVIVCAGWYPNPCKLLISKPGMWHTLLICVFQRFNWWEKSDNNDDHINRLHKWNVSKFIHLKKSLESNPHWQSLLYWIGKKTVQMNFDDLLLKPEKKRKQRSQRNVKYLKTKEKSNYLCTLSNERISSIQKQSICQLKHVNG